MLIQETQDGQGHTYQLHADVTLCDHPNNHYNLIFYTFYSNARDCNGRQIKSQFILNEQGLRNLRLLLPMLLDHEDTNVR